MNCYVFSNAPKHPNTFGLYPNFRHYGNQGLQTIVAMKNMIMAVMLRRRSETIRKVPQCCWGLWNFTTCIQCGTAFGVNVPLLIRARAEV